MTESMRKYNSQDQNNGKENYNEKFQTMEQKKVLESSHKPNLDAN